MSRVTQPVMVEITFWGCSECETWAYDHEWNLALGTERCRRKEDPEYQDAEEDWPMTDWGLDDRIVCPNCRFVHAYDDSSYVDELSVKVTVPDLGPVGSDV